MKRIYSILLVVLSLCVVSCDKQYSRIMLHKYGPGDITRTDTDFKAENDSAAFIQTLQLFLMYKYSLNDETVSMFRVVNEDGYSVRCPYYISEDDWSTILSIAGVYKQNDVEYVRSSYENFFCY